MYHVIVGDAAEKLRTLPPKSFHTCVTSPPYYGLRDYGEPGQIGLEQTPEEYVLKLISVFHEVKRVLRDDGTLWLNLGDCYSSKQLLGIPWRVAFALQADGWYLRQDIIWHKPNPIPSSVRDRCTSSHEHIFLFSKSPRYYFDWYAISTETKDISVARDKVGYSTTEKDVGNRDASPGSSSRTRNNLRETYSLSTRSNKRDVWTISVKSYKGAHFAVFPPELVEPCILAGSPLKCCVSCGSPCERILNRIRTPTRPGTNSTKSPDPQRHVTKVESVGFNPPSCRCGTDYYAPGRVLDPFVGSGTTLGVAAKHGRVSTGIELSAKFASLIQARVDKICRR